MAVPVLPSLIDVPHARGAVVGMPALRMCQRQPAKELGTPVLSGVEIVADEPNDAQKE